MILICVSRFFKTLPYHPHRSALCWSHLRPQSRNRRSCGGSNNLLSPSWDLPGASSRMFPQPISVERYERLQFFVTRSKFGLNSASSLGLSNVLAPHCHLGRNSLRLVVLLRPLVDPFGPRPFLRSSRTGMISGIRCEQGGKGSNLVICR